MSKPTKQIKGWKTALVSMVLENCPVWDAWTEECVIDFIEDLLRQERLNLLKAKNLPKFLEDYKKDIERARQEGRLKLLGEIELRKLKRKMSYGKVIKKEGLAFAQGYNRRDNEIDQAIEDLETLKQKPKE